MDRRQADRHLQLAITFSRNGQYEQALDAYRKAIALMPDHATACNNLAWLLLTGPEKLRNPEEALPLSRRAAELDLSNLCLNTLGVALYRTGDFAEAVKVLTESLRLSSGESDAFDLYFLAMCHHKLGDKVAAKDCRERAGRWFRERQATLLSAWRTELTAFEVEADAVLKQPPGQDGKKP